MSIDFVRFITHFVLFDFLGIFYSVNRGSAKTNNMALSQIEWVKRTEQTTPTPP